MVDSKLTMKDMKSKEHHRRMLEYGWEIGGGLERKQLSRASHCHIGVLMSHPLSCLSSRRRSDSRLNARCQGNTDAHGPTCKQER